MCEVVFFFFFFIGFSPSSLVRSGMPCVPPLATRHRKAPLGFLMAPEGSKELKMVKREEHEGIGQGNKWMATPVTRLGWEGRGKDNTNAEFLPTFCEGNENKCLILLHPHLQAIFSLVWHHDSSTYPKPTTPEIWATVRAASAEHTAPPLCFGKVFGVKDSKIRSSSGTGQVLLLNLATILWNKTFTPP